MYWIWSFHRYCNTRRTNNWQCCCIGFGSRKYFRIWRCSTGCCFNMCRYNSDCCPGKCRCRYCESRPNMDISTINPDKSPVTVLNDFFVSNINVPVIYKFVGIWSCWTSSVITHRHNLAKCNNIYGTLLIWLTYFITLNSIISN